MTRYLYWLRKSKWAPWIVGGGTSLGLYYLMGLTFTDWQWWAAVAVTGILLVDYRR